MSFTSITKTEVSKINLNKAETISELSAIIKNIGTITNDIKITTENASLARMLFYVVKEIYGVISKITVRQGYNFNKKYQYILEIKEMVENIKLDLNLNNLDYENNYLLDDISLKRAYLMGVFLAVGSINDPKKSRYHLEFFISDEKYAKFICNLLNSFNLNSKVLKRENKYMVYIKEAEKISDFLRIINATNSLLYYENIRIYRESKNMTNRLNNCEQANVDKIIMSASLQIKDIELIQKNNLYDTLDEKLKEVIKYRLEYPEVSMKELSEIMSSELETKITKSGLNHRLKRIKEIANKLRNNKN